MKKQIQQVRDFHKFYMQEDDIDAVPEKFTKEMIERRLNLIKEEVAELEEALKEQDQVHVGKELADLLYVVFGSVSQLGYTSKMEEIFEAVHQNNLGKLWPDGKPRFREDGKVLKPPSYDKSKIHQEVKKILKKQEQENGREKEKRK